MKKLPIIMLLILAAIIGSIVISGIIQHKVISEVSPPFWNEQKDKVALITETIDGQFSQKYGCFQTDWFRSECGFRTSFVVNKKYTKLLLFDYPSWQFLREYELSEINFARDYKSIQPESQVSYQFKVVTIGSSKNYEEEYKSISPLACCTDIPLWEDNKLAYSEGLINVLDLSTGNITKYNGEQLNRTAKDGLECTQCPLWSDCDRCAGLKLFMKNNAFLPQAITSEPYLLGFSGVSKMYEEKGNSGIVLYDDFINSTTGSMEIQIPQSVLSRILKG